MFSKFRCPKCDFCSVTPRNIISHIRSVHNLPTLKIFRCAHCLKSHASEFGARADSEAHLKQQNRDLGASASAGALKPISDKKFWPKDLQLNPPGFKGSKRRPRLGQLPQIARVEQPLPASTSPTLNPDIQTPNQQMQSDIPPIVDELINEELSEGVRPLMDDTLETSVSVVVQLCNSLKSVKAQHELDSVVASFINALNPQTESIVEGAPSKPYFEVPVYGHTSISAAYRKNRRKCIESLISHESPHCTLQRKQCMRTFRSWFQ